MKVYFIRHGETPGNLEHRYVGRTDEGLLDASKEALSERKVRFGEPVDRIYVSPMKRCLQTAAILFPGLPQVVIEDLRECDFGDFEYRNYAELSGNLDYQAFIDSFGQSGFPGGEDLKSFQERCVKGFLQALSDHQGREGWQERSLAFVVHGGTVMTLFDRFSKPHRSFYEWQLGNGEGLCATLDREGDGLSFTGCGPF